ncbi:hypothetical protein [Streptomyces sp. NRRL WC-3549]|uniref:hypothetical protein n=1 Tax=Streptomyces sp. NRRL WC-3549 TaxID=1463925 RepID=UPI000A6103C2|nr:hypothetical protein [Streptomyces sp. NRRL WC-3549]
MTLLKAQLSYHQGDAEQAAHLVDSIAGEANLLEFRDLVRFKTLREMLAARRRPAGRRLRELAAEVQMARMPDLSAEVWRAAAESLSGEEIQQAPEPESA